MRNALFGAVAAAILTGAGMTSTSVVAAPTRSALPPTADVVIAIDQSSSMQSSDPNGLRVSVVERVLSSAQDYVGRPVIRLGVVTFGSPQVDPPTGPNILRPLAPIEQANVSQETLDRRQSLAGTDFISALCASWTLVTEREAPSTAGCPPAQFTQGATSGAPAPPVVSRTVVLITDGFPAPEGQDLGFSVGDSAEDCESRRSEAHHYLCEVRRVWQGLAQTEPVNLYVIGLTTSPVADPYWRALTDCRTDSRCRVAVRRAFDPQSFAKEVLDGATLNLPMACGARDEVPQCSLPPWLSQVRFSVRGVSSGEALRIVDAQRRDRRAGAHAVFVGSESEWVIQRPSKGSWRVESANSAKLAVSAVLTAQSFQVEVNGRPTAGDDITLTLVPDGPLLLDQTALIGEQVEVHARRVGYTETVQVARVSEVLHGRVSIASAIHAAQAGEWDVSVAARYGDRAIFLSRGAFTVQASADGVVAATSSAASVSTGQITSAVCANGQAPALAETGRYRFGFTLEYPLRFHQLSAVVADGASTCDGNSKNQTATLEAPAWVTVERRVGIGYWLPVVTLLVAVGGPATWFVLRRRRAAVGRAR